MDENATELERRKEALFTQKASLDALHQELALNFYPERADFMGERARSEEFGADLFDSEPVRCRRDLGNARAAMLRPRGQPWFRAALADDEVNERPDVSRALDQVNTHARSLMYQARTGFVRAQKEADHDLVTFGNSIQTTESVVAKDGIRRLLYRCWHPRDCVWLDDADGVTQDFMARRFPLSARHIRQKFPDAELHDDIKRCLEDNKEPDKEFPLCHIMMLADEYDYYKKPGRKAQYVSVYYDTAHKVLLSEGPSDRFRYVVSRWGTISGSQYGYSPAAMSALPDARGMQIMARVLLEVGEKSLDPPLKAKRDKIVGDVNNFGAGVTWIDGEYDERLGLAIEPLLPGNLNPGIGIDLINRTTFSLRDIWYLTQLKLPQNAKTAYETAQLVEEFIRANIPLFEPWEADTELMLHETFGLLRDQREFLGLEDWPDFEFKFANPLQDAIEKNKVNQANVVFGLLAGARQIDPKAGRRIDLEKVIEGGARGIGAPADWIIDEEQAQEQAEAEAQASNIVAALSGAQQAAEVANTGMEAVTKLQGLTQPAAA